MPNGGNAPRIYVDMRARAVYVRCADVYFDMRAYVWDDCVSQPVWS